nr:immunoglobulin heavy chain junction region [Macaca mulatta]MOW98352.1 immunoglobulin heavy chain junction region [Macaca mulatta]MOW98650.1 immunoglobulin heavy chain junction region [Macaca mulatta]MOW98780.1 immunoglobulin heavy chain junction region [Macaca mulatta]MOW99066.1 immunoglobulin heavy chain junction region [Macaca mulatta]
CARGRNGIAGTTRFFDVW